MSWKNGEKKAKNLNRQLSKSLKINHLVAHFCFTPESKLQKMTLWASVLVECSDFTLRELT